MFANRTEAGHKLARQLAARSWRAAPLVVALPRGGVPIGVEVARRLGAPLDLVLVRKIGVPWHRELAVAAVVDGAQPEVVVDEPVRASCDVDPAYIERQARIELVEIERRRQLYLGGRAPLPVRGTTVIVVDDGLATGTSMRAALKALRRREPARLVLAVPVAPRDTLLALQDEVDEVVCLETPSPFHAVGAHYADFHQVSDDEVVRAMREFLLEAPLP
jgi:putative phosphoribosyl transferase